MAFIFDKTVQDIIRNQHKKKGNIALQELPNLAIHGITPNGTYFFCNLVYKKDLTVRNNINIFKLIDAYANTVEHAERVKLKFQIKEACGEQIEGIALLFSNSCGTYGFVTGDRVKVTQGRAPGPLELDTDELFSDLEHQLQLSFDYLIFILEDENAYTPQIIQQFMQGNEDDESINTEVVNAIKYIKRFENPVVDMSRYLKTACDQIKNDEIQQQVKAVYDALQLLSHDDSEIKYKATILTLQLLYFQKNEERKQLLDECTKIESMLFGSKIPTKMIFGISLVILGLSSLIFLLLNIHNISFFAIILFSYNSAITIPFGLMHGIDGKNEFYSDNAKQKRITANTFFSLKENLKIITEDLIPRKINAHSNK